MTNDQRRATATLLIASLPLPLFVKFNSGATAAITDKNRCEQSLPLFATAPFAALTKIGVVLLM